MDEPSREARDAEEEAAEDRGVGRRTRQRWLKRWREDGRAGQRFPLLVVAVIGFWLILLWLLSLGFRAG